MTSEPTSRRPEASILEIDQNWFDTDAKYPGIWITRVYKHDDGEMRRDYCDLYPTGGPNDADGGIAFGYGSEYYVEAMRYVDAADREKRIDCFKAAEILYLNAAEKGNINAILSLGYIYSYNRCEGQYFQDFRYAETAEDYKRKVDHRARAFECYKKAADLGSLEAWYKLGDAYRWEMGCEEDPAKAFECYKTAYEGASYFDYCARGNAALRLGSCFEEAYGCERDVEKSLRMYEKAVLHLGRIVDEGDWFYEKSLARARDGLARMKQEVSFGAVD